MTDSLCGRFVPNLDRRSAHFRRFFVVLGVISSSVIHTGCASTTPAVRTEIAEADRPVPIACVSESQIPPAPALIGRLPDDARAALDLTAAKLIEVRLYGRTLAGLLKACDD